MNYKDEIIGEILDNAEAWEVIDIVDMDDQVYKKFEDLLEDLSNDDLIEAFEYHVGVDYEEFLKEHEMMK